MGLCVDACQRNGVGAASVLVILVFLSTTREANFAQPTSPLNHTEHHKHPESVDVRVIEYGVQS